MSRTPLDSMQNVLRQDRNLLFVLRSIAPPLAIFILASCGQAAGPAAPQAPASPASGARSAPLASQAQPSVNIPAQPDPMKVGYTSTAASSSLLWITKEGSFFSKYGIDADLQYLSPSVFTAALANGDLDIGYASAANVPTLVARGADLVILGASYQGPIFSVIGEKGIDSLEALRAKTIGVTTLGATTDLLARQLLQGVGMTPGEDAPIVPLQNATNQVAALQKGDIQAAVLAEPGASIALSLGFVMVYNQAKEGIKSVGTVLTIRKSYLATHRDLVKRFLMATLEAIHLMKTNPQQAAPYTAKYMQIDDPVILLSSVQSIANITDDRLGVPLEDLGEKMKITAATDPTVASIQPKDIVDTSIVDELVQSGFVANLYKK